MGRLSEQRTEMDGRGLLHLDFDVGLDNGREAWRHDFHLVNSRTQVGETVDSRRIRSRRPHYAGFAIGSGYRRVRRSEEHTSELQSLTNLVCRLLLEKKKNGQVRRRGPEHRGLVVITYHHMRWDVAVAVYTY